MEYYTILWFEIDGQWIGTNCTYKDIKKGTVKIDLYNRTNRKHYSIENCDIQDCVYVSRLPYHGSDKKFVKWDDRNKLFEKYPELKQLCA